MLTYIDATDNTHTIDDQLLKIYSNERDARIRHRTEMTRESWQRFISLHEGRIALRRLAWARRIGSTVDSPAVIQAADDEALFVLGFLAQK